MAKIFKIMCFTLVVLLLSGCGGGSNDDASVTTYPFKTAFINALQKTSEYNFTITGIQNTIHISGLGTVVDHALIPGTFRGTPSQQQTSIITGYVRIGGVLLSLDQTDNFYYDADFNYLGQTGSDFLIVSGRTYLPETVTVGDSGILYMGITYTDDSFMEQSGTQTASFFIEEGIIPDSARYTLVVTNYDLTGEVDSTTTNVFHLHTDGTITPSWSKEVFAFQTIAVTFQ